VGDNLRLNITADRSGLLVVYDLDVNGKLSKLYPSPNGVALAARANGKSAGWIKPDIDIVMPDAYAGAVWPVSPPYGQGRLIALLIEDAAQVEAQIQKTRSFEVVERPLQQLGQLREVANWSVTQVDYEIVQ